MAGVEREQITNVTRSPDQNATSHRNPRQGLRCRRRLSVVVTAASVLLISPVQAFPQRQAPSNPISAPAGPQAIPASVVAERAEDLKRLLHRVETQLAGSPSVQD